MKINSTIYVIVLIMYININIYIWLKFKMIVKKGTEVVHDIRYILFLNRRPQPVPPLHPSRCLLGAVTLGPSDYVFLW